MYLLEYLLFKSMLQNSLRTSKYLYFLYLVIYFITLQKIMLKLSIIMHLESSYDFVLKGGVFDVVLYDKNNNFWMSRSIINQ